MQNALLYTLTVLIWGSTWFVITFQLGVVEPFVSLAYRFGLAAILLFIFCLATGRVKKAKFTLRQHSYIALQGGMLFSLSYFLSYQGVSLLSSGLVAVCFSTMSIMNTVNQRIFFKLPIRRQVLLGSFFGMSGIMLLFWPEVQTLSLKDASIIGLGVCLLASLTASWGNMFAYRNSRDEMPVMMTNCYGMAYGAIFSLTYALAVGMPINFDPSFNYIWSLLYLAILGSAVAFGCYFTLMKSIGADKAAYATVLFPLVALTISTVFENYIWTYQAAIGIALILFGNILSMGNLKKIKNLILFKKYSPQNTRSENG